jgi:hypothetical protein
MDGALLAGWSGIENKSRHYKDGYYYSGFGTSE